MLDTLLSMWAAVEYSVEEAQPRDVDTHPHSCIHQTQWTSDEILALRRCGLW